jgi:phage gpG-like protein
MTEKSAFSIDNTKLSKFVKTLEGFKGQEIRLGVFGNTTSREGSGPQLQGKKAPPTNAELAMVHEFGSKTRNIPMRSFLRMPVHQKSKEIYDVAIKGAIDLFIKGESAKILNRIGSKAVAVVMQAFATSGFGQWASPKRRSGSPLVDTGQLRRSILFKVVEK